MEQQTGSKSGKEYVKAVYCHPAYLTYMQSTRRRQWQATPVLLPRKSHGRRSLVGCSPWGHYWSDTTEWLHFYFSLSCIGEGDGNPPQCSCLENPRDGGAWWAAGSGVAQSWTRLKQLSSSSSRWIFGLTVIPFQPCVSMISPHRHTFTIASWEQVVSGEINCLQCRRCWR